jgi:hypothetical protein
LPVVEVVQTSGALPHLLPLKVWAVAVAVATRADPTVPMEPQTLAAVVEVVQTTRTFHPRVDQVDPVS